MAADAAALVKTSAKLVFGNSETNAHAIYAKIDMSKKTKLDVCRDLTLRDAINIARTNNVTNVIVNVNRLIIDIHVYFYILTL